MRTRVEVLKDIDLVLGDCKGCRKPPICDDTSAKERYCLKECDMTSRLEPYRQELIDLTSDVDRNVVRVKVEYWESRKGKGNRYKLWQKDEVLFILECKRSKMKPREVVDAFYKKFNEVITIGMARGIMEKGERNAVLSL